MSGRPDPALDHALAHLPPEGRWREWMRRIEAVLFASATPVPRVALARVVGHEVSVDLLLDDLAAELAERPYEVVRIGAGWMLRTRPAYGPAIRAAADLPEAGGELPEGDLAVLATIAYHQPITRDGLKEVFGKDVSRDLIGRLSARDLITPGPRAPRRGAPYTYVTTDAFLARFGLATLDDLPDPEQVQDAGLESPREQRDEEQ